MAWYPGFVALLFGICYLAFPYTVLVLYPPLSRLDPALPEASQTLGASPVRTFFSVVVGSLRNAIPREAFAVVTTHESKQNALKDELEIYFATVKSELSATEPELKIEVLKTDMPACLIDADSAANLLKALYGCPNGVLRMSDAVEGLVETSTNLAIVNTAKGKVDVCTMQRSSVDSSRTDLCAMIRSVFELAGGHVVHEGEYPGWKPNPDSPILKIMQKAYLDKYGKTPEIRAIHAGLECGLLIAVYPKLDAVSFGPTIRSPHSPDEKVNIETVGKFWDFLVETLLNIDDK
ncbi:MAG: M20/M25/M40 family metallo-hydrolase [bacterium]|nr:M20/M25/M40 family metallo-hydrolase [bacterium]